MTKETGQPQMPKITRNPTQWSADWGRFHRMKNDAAYLAANHKRLQAENHAMGAFSYRLENENRVLKAEVERLKGEVESLMGEARIAEKAEADRADRYKTMYRDAIGDLKEISEGASIKALYHAESAEYINRKDK